MGAAPMSRQDILGYISKIYEKDNSGHKGLTD